MLEIIVSNQFKKDLRLAQKRGCKIALLKEIVNKLAYGIKLDEKYCDHGLTSNYRGFRECHVEPDWLLIYRVNQDSVALFLLRTGTHSDLFS